MHRSRHLRVWAASVKFPTAGSPLSQKHLERPYESFCQPQNDALSGSQQEDPSNFSAHDISEACFWHFQESEVLLKLLHLILMLVQSLENGGPVDSVDWRHRCIIYSTVISISCFIEIVFLAVISVEQLETLTEQTTSG